MKKILLGLMFICAVFGAHAQQEAQYTQYMINPYLINPAYASVEDLMDIKTGYRAQWLGFNEYSQDLDNDGFFDDEGNVAPRTMYLSAHTPIGKPHWTMHFKGEHQNWHGAGAKIVSDKTGPSSWTSFLASYTYNMGIIKPKGSGIYTKGGLRMSAGAFVGMQQYKLNGDALRFGTSGDPTQASISKLMPDATVGVWLYDTKNELYWVGFSANHIFGNKIRVPGIDPEDANEDPALARHFFLTAGTSFELTNQWKWQPSFLVKFVAPAAPAIDLNSKFIFEDAYWGAVSYRHLDALSIAAGATINYMFEIAYSYDFTTTEIRTYGNGGTHEITLGIRLSPHGHNSNAEDHWK